MTGDTAIEAYAPGTFNAGKTGKHLTMVTMNTYKVQKESGVYAYLMVPDEISLL